MSFWAPFTSESRRLIEGAGFRSVTPNANAVSLLREILSSNDPNVNAVISELGLSDVRVQVDRILSDLQRNRALRSAGLRRILDFAFRRSASQQRSRVTTSDLLAALLSDRALSTAMRNAGVDVDRALTILLNP